MYPRQRYSSVEREQKKRFGGIESYSLLCSGYKATSCKIVAEKPSEIADPPPFGVPAYLNTQGLGVECE